MLHWLFLITFFLVWGSFLNVVAYRLIKSQSIIWPASHCPYCKQAIAWYDNIPIISWLLLKGSCRSCKKPISDLYLFIELLSAVIFSLLYLRVNLHYFPAYFIFFSALIVSIRTDLEHMLLSRTVTLWAIPFALVFSYLGLLPITVQASIIGTLFGYLVLFIIAQLFYFFTKKHGLGEGDPELLAFIGSFIGIKGIFVTLLIGSWVGSVISLIYLYVTKKDMKTPLPFGPFLALGAIVYVLFSDAIQLLFSFYIM